ARPRAPAASSVGHRKPTGMGGGISGGTTGGASSGGAPQWSHGGAQQLDWHGQAQPQSRSGMRRRQQQRSNQQPELHSTAHRATSVHTRRKCMNNTPF